MDYFAVTLDCTSLFIIHARSWYMSPEYAYWGHVSTKSDIFSFGVIVLEMVTRQRNNSAYSDTSDSVSVLSHVCEIGRAHV